MSTVMMKTPLQILEVVEKDGINYAKIGDCFGDWVMNCREYDAEALLKVLNAGAEPNIPETRDEFITRLEDMSPMGRMSVLMQGDADVVVQVVSGDQYGDVRAVAGVEFCVPGTGGGGSPRTHKALVELARAMELDNQDRTLDGRKLEYVIQKRREEEARQKQQETEQS